MTSVKSVKAANEFDSVAVLFGWDSDNNLRIVEDTEWELDFHWMADPTILRLHVPKSLHPEKKKKPVINIFISEDDIKRSSK